LKPSGLALKERVDEGGGERRQKWGKERVCRKGINDIHLHGIKCVENAMGQPTNTQKKSLPTSRKTLRQKQPKHTKKKKKKNPRKAALRGLTGNARMPLRGM